MVDSPFIQYLDGGGDPSSSQVSDTVEPLGVEKKPVGLLRSFTFGLYGSVIE